MPKLHSPIHLQMLHDSYARGDTDEEKLYGIEWGDPNERPFLKLVRDQFIQPYINLDRAALEIGPGGGRWTRYLLSFRRVFVVDLHQELLDELAKKFRAPHLVPIKSSGTNFPGIPIDSIDYVFSFGVFVHFDAPIIEAYLRALFPTVKDTANVVIQYSDKRKPEAASEPTFADNDPDRMRAMVAAAGFIAVEENLTALPHSAIMRFRKRRADEHSF